MFTSELACVYVFLLIILDQCNTWFNFQFYDLRVGKDSIRVRVYDSQSHKAEHSRSALLFLHGGGWSLGSIGRWNESFFVYLLHCDVKLCNCNCVSSKFKNQDAAQFWNCRNRVFCEKNVNNWWIFFWNDVHRCWADALLWARMKNFRTS